MKETSASRPSPSGSFWMIVSTLQLASASALKIARGGARAVGHAEQRDPGLLGRVGDGGDQGVFHGLVLSEHNGTGAVLEARAAVDPHAVGARVLDRAQLQHLGARGRHLEHLLEADEAAACGRRGRSAGRRVKTPGDVGVDLAHLGADRGGQRDRGRVRAAATERGHVAARRHALEAGDEHDQVLVERLADPVGAHVEDPRLRVRGVGDDPRLRAGQRDRPVAEVVDRHRAQRAGDPLAGREQHVHLARVGSRRDLLGHRDQLVGRLARARTAPRRRGCRPRAGRRSAAPRA